MQAGLGSCLLRRGGSSASVLCVYDMGKLTGKITFASPKACGQGTAS